MKLNLYLLLSGIILMAVQLPLLIHVFTRRNWVDNPDERKKHKKAIPAIGGLALGLTLLELSLVFPSLREFWMAHHGVALPMLVLLITGAWDDQKNLSSRLRFLIQAGCAVYLVASGVSVGFLGGIFGFHELPFWFDASLTVIAVIGVTNAFNLIDGIDGLSGGMALMNLLTFALIAYLSGNAVLFSLALTWAAMTLVFLFYNWSPAKVFMGDGGSLVFGFFFIAMGLSLRQSPEISNALPSSASLALLAALLMVPVTDTLRVFAFRISQGRSPYSADRNHLHHWIVRNRTGHTIATLRILLVHALILPFTIFLIYMEMPLFWILITQFGIVLAYTKLVQMITNFNRWYRFIRRFEMSEAGYTV